jgi:hypothetical protein
LALAAKNTQVFFKITKCGAPSGKLQHWAEFGIYVTTRPLTSTVLTTSVCLLRQIARQDMARATVRRTQVWHLNILPEESAIIKNSKSIVTFSEY